MIESLVLYFLSPLSLSLWAGFAAAVLAVLRRRRAAVVLAAGAFVWLWVCSTPLVAHTLVRKLEGQYPAVAPEAAESADAIVVLGGAVSGAKPPERPTLGLGASSSRVWYAAALYRAGKAPRVLVAGGNREPRAHEQVEADAIAELLVQLGVPRSAIVLEGGSRTTRENARYALPLLRQLGARRVLLVTSGIHMPRAMRTFVTIWGENAPQLIPAVTDVQGSSSTQSGWELWFPSLDALINVNKCLKEIAGIASLAIIL